MRKTLSDILVGAAQNNPEFLVLSGDHGYALFDDIRSKCPDQFLNCGIAEQNMVGVAAGLAKAGMRPAVYGLAAFVPIRVLEQIKIDLCLEGVPVILLGDGAGFVYSGLGASHQCFEDVAALRAMGGIEIYAPADRHELERCFIDALAAKGPSYIRLCKADLGDVHGGAIASSANLNALPVIASGKKNLCLASGSMVRLVKNVIQEHGLEFDLYSVAKLKDCGMEAIANLCEGRERVVTIEEHSVFGGLGSLVAEAIAGRIITRFEAIGIRDKYSRECGTYQYMLQYHGLDERSLYSVLSKADD